MLMALVFSADGELRGKERAAQVTMVYRNPGTTPKL
jgi:hypothetical protein